MASKKIAITTRKYAVTPSGVNPRTVVTIGSTSYDTEVIDGILVAEGHITDPGVENKRD